MLYEQGHFSLRAPLGFSTEQSRADLPIREGRISGPELYKRWTAAGFPRMIAVTFQHPTMFFDDSYAVNSANNGPYGDAIMNELIPYVEEHFRIIRQPYARVLVRRIDRRLGVAGAAGVPSGILRRNMDFLS